MKKYKNLIISGAIILAVLAFTYWWGGNSVGLHGWTVEKPKTDQSLTAEEKIALAEEKIAESESEQTEQPQKFVEEEIPIDPATTEKTSANLQDESVPDTCTISIRCDTILNNLDYLIPEKASVVPPDGTILTERSVPFTEGESVFDILLRETRKNNIHMEYASTPVYKSAYIEGIGNLYEFDCGELSGWMYRVNGWFPNYGCSRYQVQPGDKIEWVYTCDLGVDVGGHYSAGLNQD